MCLYNPVCTRVCELCRQPPQERPLAENIKIFFEKNIVLTFCIKTIIDIALWSDFILNLRTFTGILNCLYIICICMFEVMTVNYISPVIIDEGLYVILLQTILHVVIWCSVLRVSYREYVTIAEFALQTVFMPKTEFFFIWFGHLFDFLGFLVVYILEKIGGETIQNDANKMFRGSPRKPKMRNLGSKNTFNMLAKPGFVAPPQTGSIFTVPPTVNTSKDLLKTDISPQPTNNELPRCSSYEHPPSSIESRMYDAPSPILQSSRDEVIREGSMPGYNLFAKCPRRLSICKDSPVTYVPRTYDAPSPLDYLSPTYIHSFVGRVRYNDVPHYPQSYICPPKYYTYFINPQPLDLSELSIMHSSQIRNSSSSQPINYSSSQPQNYPSFKPRYSVRSPKPKTAWVMQLCAMFIKLLRNFMYKIKNKFLFDVYYDCLSHD